MITHSVSEVLDKHVTLDIEGIDRLYLNAYVPLLQSPGGVSYFFRRRHDAPIASPALMAPMSHRFTKAVAGFARRQGLETVRFRVGERKDDVTRARLRSFQAEEGVLYIGTAQERFSTFRFARRTDDGLFNALYRSAVMCKQFYFYLVDADFGPLFIKISSYFPYTARVCLNGHEYAKRQLAKAGIAFEALNNGVLSCADPARLQAILDASMRPGSRRW